MGFVKVGLKVCTHFLKVIGGGIRVAEEKAVQQGIYEWALKGIDCRIICIEFYEAENPADIELVEKNAST